jgi:hypothetical protein
MFFFGSASLVHEDVAHIRFVVRVRVHRVVAHGHGSKGVIVVHQGSFPRVAVPYLQCTVVAVTITTHCDQLVTGGARNADDKTNEAVNLDTFDNVSGFAKRCDELASVCDENMALNTRECQAAGLAKSVMAKAASKRAVAASKHDDAARQ